MKYMSHTIQNVKYSLLLILSLACLMSNATDFAITFNVSHYQNGNNISCHGANDGMVEAVIVGGTPPYTYSWNTGSYNRVLTGLTAGTYTFTVTDAASQTISQPIDLIEPNNLQLFLWPEFYGGYNVSEQGGSNGIIAAEVQGGSMPYSYSWSNGGTKDKLKNLSAGSYSLVLTDANGCTVTASQTLTEPTPLHVVSITSPLHHGFNISCTGGSDGLIDLSVTGGVPPYKYDWNTGSFEEDINELTAGEYSVRITDDNQAEIITSIILTQPAGSLKVTLTPQVYANSYNLSCHDCANGSLTAVGSSGVAPYTFLWSNSQTVATISGLQAINYSCVITDVNGCTSTEAFLLRAPDRDDWSMNGNANVDPATQFMGTTDNRDFVFKTNNVERMRIKSTGVVQVLGGLKIDTVSTDSLRAVYVDQGGVLRTGIGTGSGSCAVLANAWMANYCNTPTGNIYLRNIYNNVGLGTTTPRDKLEVVGFGRFTSTSNSQNYLSLGNDGLYSYIDAYGGNSLSINQQSEKDVHICDGGAGDLYVGGNTVLALTRGSVGIGTLPNSSYGLDVNSGTNSFDYFLRGNKALTINANQELVLNSGNSDPSIYSEFNGVLINGGLTKGITLSSWKAGTQIFLDGRIKIVNFGQDTKKHLLFTDMSDEISGLTLENDIRKVLASDGTWKLLSDLGDWHVEGDHIYHESVGCVGIGLSSFPTDKDWPMQYKLAVNGSIMATELKIQLKDNWADYVFKSDYKLMPLDDLSCFIEANDHLPDVPSCNEVKKNDGIEIGKMNVILLKKVEELTLYLIELNDKYTSLETKLKSIQGEQ